MRKKLLQMRIHAREPSVVDITVRERVQLDQVVRSPDGYVPERHGDLLAPGTTRLALDQGFYFFKTLSSADLKVIRGGVDTSARTNDKDPWPDPPEVAGQPPSAPRALGDEPADDHRDDDDDRDGGSDDDRDGGSDDDHELGVDDLDDVDELADGVPDLRIE